MIPFRQIIAGFIQILFAVAMIAFGVIVCILPWVEPLRLLWAKVLQLDAMFLVVGGMGTAAIGFVLLALCFFPMQRQYYLIEMNSDRICVNRKVLLQYLQIYFRKLFPQHDCKLDLLLRDNRFEIQVDLPLTDEEQQEQMLKKIEEELSQMLQSTLGYLPSFYLSLRFQS